MNAEQLKASIIQQAIEGKLVSQLDSEEPVEQIGTAPGEVPFEIPESWKWLRLDGMATIVRGGSPRPIKSFITEREDGLNWIKIGDAERGTARISHCAEKIIKDGLKKTRLIKKGSLLLTNSMSFGYPYILDVDGCIHDGWLAFSDFESVVSRDYLYYALLSPYCRSIFIAKAAGAVVKNLNIDKVKEVFIPVPPLQEQARIVAKIEELLPLVEAYGKSYDRLQELNAELPGKLKASILQEAIQGKLVPQLDSEEEVQQIGDAPEDVPFAIPEKWKWTCLEKVADFYNGYAFKSSSYVDQSLNQVIRLGNVKMNRLELEVKPVFVSDKVSDSQSLFHIKPNDILVTMTGTKNKKDYFYSTLVLEADLKDRKLLLNQRVGCIRAKEKVLPEFLCLVLQEKTIRDGVLAQETGTANQGNISSSAIKSIKVPIPPKDEQKRIVDSINSLMEQIEALSRK